MSVEAMVWALKDAPDVPAHLVATLVGLANHADPDGRNSWPSQGTLSRYTRKSDRAVRKDLRELVALGLVRVGDQRMVGHIPAGKRPVVYDLATDRNPSSARNPSSTPDTGTTVPPTPEPEFRPTPELEFRIPRNSSSDKPSLNRPTEPSTNRPGSELALRHDDIVDADIVEDRQTAQTLIAEWIDHRDADDKPPARTKGLIAKRVKELLDEGIPYAKVRRGLQLWDDKRKHPSTLDSFVDEAGAETARKTTTTRRPSTADLRAASAFALAQQYAERGE